MMKHWSKSIAAAIILIPLATGIVAYADTSSTTTTANVTANATVKTTINAQSRFEQAYQKNEATETTLLAQADHVQSSQSPMYSAFVSATATQVSTLYASEQALSQLGTSWNSVAKSNASGALTNQKNNLTKELQNLEHRSAKGKKVSAKYRKDVAKIKTQVRVIDKDITRLNRLMTMAKRLRLGVTAGNFNSNVGHLCVTILGLQRDEIQVTKAWIASGDASVTGSVYGSTNS